MSNTVQFTRGQREHIANGGPCILNERQRAALQRSGLLAEAEEYYRHPEGAFYLMPTHSDARKRQRRKRINLK